MLNLTKLENKDKLNKKELDSILSIRLLDNVFTYGSTSGLTTKLANSLTDKEVREKSYHNFYADIDILNDSMKEIMLHDVIETYILGAFREYYRGCVLSNFDINFDIK